MTEIQDPAKHDISTFEKTVKEAGLNHGRGAWTKVGMPPNGTGYYQLLNPIHVGSIIVPSLDYRAVTYGVKAFQKRINEMGWTPKLTVDGDFGLTTSTALHWAQKKVNVVVDGQGGPHTATAMFYPVLRKMNSTVAPIAGAICHLESGFDPGAVGYVVADDLGLAQINLSSNPNVTEASAFDFRFALTYLTGRITAALNKYKNHDAAIVSYNSPLWAKEWEQTGKAPNSTAQQYVDLVKAWKPPE